MALFVVFLLSLVLHVLLGWLWTPLAAFLVGLFRPRWATLRGGAGVALGWAAMLFWFYVTATQPTAAMLEVLGGLLGNLPGEAIVGLTLALAFLLGALGGLAGGLLRMLTAHLGLWPVGPPRDRTPPAPPSDFEPYQPA